MIISICGSTEGVSLVTKRLMDIFKEKLVICNFFHIGFNSVIETESVRYKMIRDDSENFRNKYDSYLNKTINKKINDFINNNKDKIIIFLTESIDKDIDKTDFFHLSDLKVLVSPNENSKSIFSPKYDKSLFDIVINNPEFLKNKIFVK